MRARIYFINTSTDNVHHDEHKRIVLNEHIPLLEENEASDLEGMQSLRVHNN